MKKGVTLMTSIEIEWLRMMRASLAQCCKGEVCYECDIVCIAWCDELNIEPEQFLKAIALIDEMKY